MKNLGVLVERKKIFVIAEIVMITAVVGAETILLTDIMVVDIEMIDIEDPDHDRDLGPLEKIQEEETEVGVDPETHCLRYLEK